MSSPMAKIPSTMPVTRPTFDGFAEIGQRLHPDIALLPIGAYHPASFRNVHTSPEDAVRAFLDLGARWMIPMHYGTFRLSHEPVHEPVERLESDAFREGIADRVLVLAGGHNPPVLSAWIMNKRIGNPPSCLLVSLNTAPVGAFP